MRADHNLIPIQRQQNFKMLYLWITMWISGLGKGRLMVIFTRKRSSYYSEKVVLSLGKGRLITRKRSSYAVVSI